MSVETERLEMQLKRMLEGEAWHGPGVLEVLQDVTAESAYAHPVSGAHSIWEIVLHLAGTYRLVLRRIQGNDLPLSPEEDWAFASTTGALGLARRDPFTSPAERRAETSRTRLQSGAA